jgi:hypothetical protein
VCLHGICLYPILGMPEWHEPDVSVQMGVWDLEPDEEGMRRVPAEEMVQALREETTRWPARRHGRDVPVGHAIAYP